MQLIVLLFIIQLCVISTLPCFNTLRLLFRTPDSWQINVKLLLYKLFSLEVGGFFVKYFSLKFEHSVIFSHWKLGSLSSWRWKTREQPFVHCELTFTINFKSKQTTSRIYFPFFLEVGFRLLHVKVPCEYVSESGKKSWIYGKERSGEMMEGQMKVKVFSGALRNGGWMLRIRSHRSMRQPLVNGRVGGSGGYWLCKWKRNSNRQ